MELVTAKRLQFAQPRAAVWKAMADVDAYQRWWPWLRDFDARALRTGDAWRCVVRAPLSYTVSFVIHFDDVIDGERVITHVDGDITGDASLTLSSVDDTTEVDVRSTLAPRSPFLRVLANTLPPVARFGHDWVLDTGAKQFEQRALRSGAGGTTT